MPNVINVIITAILGLFYKTLNMDERTKKRIYLIVIGVCLSFVSGFRGLYALSDTSAYFSTFKGSLQYTLFEQFHNNIVDFGFYCVTWILAHTGMSWQLYLLLYSAFVFGTVLYWIYDNSQDVVVSLLIFECLFLNVWQCALRQTMAMAMILWVYKLLKCNKRLWAVVLYIVSLTFHATAVIMIPFFIIKEKKITNGIIATCTAFTGLFYVFRRQFLSVVNWMADLLGRNVYLEFWKENPITLIAMCMLILFVSVILKNIIGKRYPQCGECYFALYLMLILLALGGGVMVRLAWYYGIFLCLLIPMICKCFKQEHVATLIACSMLLLLYLPQADLTTYYFCWMN